jgi:amino acid adenylation domain-containing protein
MSSTVPLAERIANLSPEQRELLERRLKKGDVELSKLLILPRSREGAGPLSFAQQRVWFHEQLDPGGVAYNLLYPVQFAGRLNVGALEKSLCEIVRRHEVLRTTFRQSGHEPTLVVSPSGELAITNVDLSALAGPEQQSRVRRLIKEEGRRPFDLMRDLLLRFTLLRLGEESHVGLLSVHHIAFDDWSLSILLRELAALYEAFAAGERSPLPELPIQYADFAAWQREWLQGDALEAQLAYWKKRLGDSPPRLSLPADSARPPKQDYRGAKCFELFPATLTSALKDLSRQENVTLFMTLMAGLQALLHRYAGQDRVIVGTPVANRNRGEVEGLIGFFANTLALDTDFSGDPTFRELLARVRQSAVEAYTYQDLPFEKLIERLGVGRNEGAPPLLQVLLNVKNQPADLKLPGLTLSALRVEPETAKFDLAVDIIELERGLSVGITYNTGLFEAGTVRRLLGHYRELLEGAAADPGGRVGGLRLLTREERRRQLGWWNATRREYEWRGGAAAEVRRAARERGGEVAVECGGAAATYAELDGSADRLAHSLLAEGVGKNAYVPVLMGRSVGLVVSWLAIWKAGAAIVPLDVDWPAQRLEHVLKELGCNVILVGDDVGADGLEKAEAVGIKVMLVDGVAADEPGPDAGVQVSPQDPAYVIYTSGSTGVPKGVVVPHAAFENRLCWMNEFFGREASRAVLQTTPTVYDSAMWEIFWPLTNGGKTILPPSDMGASAEVWAETVEAHGITICDVVPTVLNMLVTQWAGDEDVRRKLRSLRWLVVGGEAITPGLARSFLKLFPGVRMINLYGPTEACIGCIFHEVTGDEAGKIPIGKPIPNAHALILDRHGNLIPAGHTGELHLSGVCLADGYLNDEEKTRAAFVENPFEEIGYPRLYKTGDLARYLPDGSIDFVGRADSQVKIRGLRIELGEVEAALLRHPAVREAAVSVREFAPDDRRLVAFVVAEKSSPVTRVELREFLQARLPRHMTPSAYVFLEEFPVTPGGKLDRRALESVGWDQSSLEPADAAPRTPYEETLAEVWAGVLGADGVRLHDNFFDLGGHSLLATQLLSRVREAFEVELPLRSLFDSPTVEGFAKKIEKALRDGFGLSSPPIRRAPRGGPMPVSFAQEHLLLINRVLPNTPFFTIPVAVRLKGPLDVEALRKSLGEIVRRHEALRAVFGTSDGAPAQVFNPPAEFELPVIDLSGMPGERREAEALRLAATEALLPFDLARGPLFRVVLLKTGDAEHVALMTMHHIVSDGWSMGILVREVGVLYEAFSKGLPPALPELPVQYADYAVWQREWLNGDALDAQLSYWRRQLGGELEPLDMPTDRPRPAHPVFATREQSLAIPRSLSGALKRFGRQEGCSLFMTLLSAFKALLHSHTGRGDIRVGTLVANRNLRETEGLVGLFINTLVLRTSLAGDPTVRELLRRVRKTALDAYAHQDLPLEVVIQTLEREHRINRASLFETMFFLQNTSAETLSLPGLTAGPLRAGGNLWERNLSPTSCDLVFVLTETPDGLTGVLKYKHELFEEATVERMLASYARLLETLAAGPELRLSSLSLACES